MSRLSILINSLLGVCRLSFSEEDRTAVYRAIFDARLTVLSLNNLPSGFQIDLRREDSKRLSASLKEVGVLAENVKTFGVSVVLKFLLRRSGLVFGAVLGLLLFLAQKYSKEDIHTNQPRNHIRIGRINCRNWQFRDPFCGLQNKINGQQHNGCQNFGKT